MSTARIPRRDQRRRPPLAVRHATGHLGPRVPGLLLLSLLFSLGILALLIDDLVRAALPVCVRRAASTSSPAPLSSDPAKAGHRPGPGGDRRRSAVLVALIAFPIGIATAVYLEEYAPDNRLTRFITLNIRNLAGVPSVVYGLLGLAVFVALMDASTATS